MVREDIQRLKEALLKIGGGGKGNDGFAYTGYEERMDRFLEEEFTPEEARILVSWGRVFRPCRVKMVSGSRNHCHTNVARLVASDPKKFEAWTGMSLCEDGLWRSHSWAVDTDGTVVETTVPRLIYYGCPMETSEVTRLSQGW